MMTESEHGGCGGEGGCYNVGAWPTAAGEAARQRLAAEHRASRFESWATVRE